MMREVTLRQVNCDTCNKLIGQTSAPISRFLHEMEASGHWATMSVGEYAGWPGFRCFYMLPATTQYNPVYLCEECHDLLDRSNDIWLTIALLKGLVMG